MSVLLKNATYVDWQSLDFSQLDVFVREDAEDPIRLIPPGTSGELPPADTVIDCRSRIVTRAFAVGHHHVYSALARGMPAPAKKPANFPEILQYVWWSLDKCLDEESIYYSAMVTAMAAARAGSTFVIDHHASPNWIRGSLDMIAGAFRQVGLGHLLCYEVTDRDGSGRAREGLAETERYLTHNPGLVGLHASFTVGPETLERAVALMKQFATGLHVHVAEDVHDQDHCLRTYGMRVVERLQRAGALDSPATILVHALHLNDREREVVGQAPCWVAQNMESNLKNKVGYFNGQGLGRRIMLGTDGMHSDMLQSLRTAFFVGQGFEAIDPSVAYGRLRNVHRYLDLNGFEGTGRGDLVVLDYDHPTEIHKDNFLGHLLFGINSSHVRDVIASGRCIVRDRQLQTVDQEEVLRKAREAASRLWQRMQRI
jgi:cytosine/adenosine deaminase-related metal-dependent hydrolase